MVASFGTLTLQPAHAHELINTMAQIGCPEGTLKYVHLPPIYCQGQIRVPTGLSGGGKRRVCERGGRTDVFFILSASQTQSLGGRATEKDTGQSSGHFQQEESEGGGGGEESRGREIGGGRTVDSGTVCASITSPSLEKGKGARNRKMR